MTQYPRTQSQIAALANSMIGGFTEHPDYFPHSDSTALQEALDEYNSSCAALVDAQSQAAIAAGTKQEKLNKLQDIIKNQIKLSQVDCVDDPARLACIGWGQRKDAHPVSLPGQSYGLAIAAQCDCWLLLEWNKPPYDTARPVRYYSIERRKADGTDDWQSVATSINNELKLKNQPQMTRFEYRVKAVNAAGESMPSNTITAIL